MSDVSQGDGWWEAKDGKWYPPERHPEYQAAVEDARGAEYGRSPVEIARAKEFAQSPGGLARSAHEAKLPIFQWECDLSASTVKADGMVYMGVRDKNVSHVSYSTQVNLDLAAIESEGWRMTALSTAFIPHSERSRGKILSGGQDTAISGRVQAVYVFHPYPAYPD